MIFLTILAFLIITFCSIYIRKSDKRFTGSFLIFIFISVSTLIIYMNKGNMQTFTFDNSLNTKIESILNNPNSLEEMDPKLMITFLEKKLKKQPRDIDGWLILARTCVISGHYQKADLHYKSALKIFPENENLLLEYAILKKNTNQTKSSLKYLTRLKGIYPENLKAREIIIEIFFNNLKEQEALNEMKELFKMKKEDPEYISSIKKNIN